MLGNQDPRMTVVKSLDYHSAAYVLALELKKPSIDKCQQAQTKKAPTVCSFYPNRKGATS